MYPASTRNANEPSMPALGKREVWVRGDVLSDQRDGPFIDVRQDDVTALRQAGGDDPQCAVATAKIQDQLARPDLKGGEEEFRSTIDFLAREDARVGSECEGLAANGDLDLGRTSPRFRLSREVLFAHVENTSAGSA